MTQTRDQTSLPTWTYHINLVKDLIFGTDALSWVGCSIWVVLVSNSTFESHHLVNKLYKEQSLQYFSNCFVMILLMWLCGTMKKIIYWAKQHLHNLCDLSKASGTDMFVKLQHKKRNKTKLLLKAKWHICYRLGQTGTLSYSFMWDDMFTFAFFVCRP